MKGIILHAGHGTRLRPLTHTGPKQLLPIANKPMSQYALEDLRDAGITEVGVIVGGAHSGRVREYYGDGERFGVRITYIEQDSPKGIAHAVGLCREFVGGDRFVVYLGDNILRAGLRPYAERFEGGPDALVLLCRVADPSRFGIAHLGPGGIEKIVEKPADSSSDLAVIGVYFLTPSVFGIIDGLRPSGRGELEITDALQGVLDGGRLEHGFVDGWWKDTGTPEDVIDANRLVLGSEVRVGDSRVSSDSRLEGPVLVGDGCSVESSVLGPNVSVGDGCRISGCTISDSIIMDGCTLEAGGAISGSIIASGSEIRGGRGGPRRFLLGERSQVDA